VTSRHQTPRQNSSAEWLAFASVSITTLHIDCGALVEANKHAEWVCTLILNLPVENTVPCRALTQPSTGNARQFCKLLQPTFVSQGAKAIWQEDTQLHTDKIKTRKQGLYLSFHFNLNASNTQQHLMRRCLALNVYGSVKTPAISRNWLSDEE
jgi:hypothetical protein